MGLLTGLRQTSRGFGLLRRLLVELRGIRRALERQADVLELAELHAIGRRPGSTFRGFSREKTDRAGEGSSVSYVVPEELVGMLQIEEELKALLGRDPSEAELERAFQGLLEDQIVPRVGDRPAEPRS